VDGWIKSERDKISAREPHKIERIKRENKEIELHSTKGKNVHKNERIKESQ
jgi:hypothetical protein